MTSAQRSILAVAMLSQGLSVGLTIGTLPILLEPLEQAFGAPRTAIASGQILIMLSLTCASIATGVALDRGPVRRVMLAGALCLTAGLALASTASNLPILAVSAVLVGAAIPSLGPLTAGKLITHYFDEGRGRAMGLMSIGPPLGSGLFAALAGWLLVALDWTGVMRVYAVLAIGVLLPLILAIVPRHFDDVPAAAASGAVGGATEAVTMMDVVRIPAFQLAAAGFALASGVSTAWTVHAAAYVGGFGLDEAGQSNVLALQFWMGVPGSVGFGMLAERFDAGRLLTLSVFGSALCYAGFAVAPNVWVVAFLAATAGLLLGGVIPLYMVLLGHRMSPATLGRAIGVSNLFMLPIMSGAVLAAAALFERQGDYTTTLFAFAAIFASAALLFAVGRGPKRAIEGGRTA